LSKKIYGVNFIQGQAMEMPKQVNQRGGTLCIDKLECFKQAWARLVKEDN
jgi:hypothetical protein